MRSLSARRAWIEINVRSQPSKPRRVALRKESVDRNYYSDKDADWGRVVALRKESVDRNIILPKQLNRPTPSLSARRAWIEILKKMYHIT